MKDALARLPGVGDVQLLGAREYAMRIWLDPDKVAAHNLNASEVLAALRAQNVQVSAGVLNQPPVAVAARPTRSTSQTLGRLSTPEQFADIVVKSDDQGRVTRIRDIGRVEIGAADYGSTAYMDRDAGLPLLIFAQPGANSLAVEQRGAVDDGDAGEGFPAGRRLQGHLRPHDLHRQIGRRGDHHDLRCDPARRRSSCSCSCRAGAPRSSRSSRSRSRWSARSPFSPRSAYRSNNLSLFGLVLAVGIVVDDAIVVVENVERNSRAGMSPSEAAHKTMDEVGGALIAIALTLVRGVRAVGLPVGHLGQFFRQFAVTIAASTIISCFVSLTLSPALCAVLFKAHEPHHRRAPISPRRHAAGGLRSLQSRLRLAVERLWPADAAPRPCDAS